MIAAAAATLTALMAPAVAQAKTVHCPNDRQWPDVVAAQITATNVKAPWYDVHERLCDIAVGEVGVEPVGTSYWDSGHENVRHGRLYVEANNARWSFTFAIDGIAADSPVVVTARDGRQVVRYTIWQTYQR